MSQKKYQVCIVGTGAAGGILAHQLAKAGLNVISLEQGPALDKKYFTTDNPPGIKKLHGIKPKTTFPPSPQDALFIHELFCNSELRSSNERSQQQFRQFQIHAVNGLQNLWNGVCVRFNHHDMKTWPIAYDALEPYYTQVEQLITVCGTQENLEQVPDGHFIEPKPFRPADKLIINAFKNINQKNCHAIANRKAIETRKSSQHHCQSVGICTYGCPSTAMYKFSTRLLPEIESLDNYTLLTNTKVTRLIRDDKSNRIKEIECIDTVDNTQHRIQADIFILSAGAFESPRILFNSHDKKYIHGLCNTNQTLGQYLQDNPKVVLSTSLYKLWFEKRPEDIAYGDLLLLLGQETTHDGNRFNFIGHSISAPPDIPYYLKSFEWVPKRLKKYLVRAVFNSFVTLGLFCEGDLLADNCIKPSDSFDKYGVRQVDIHYRTSQQTLDKMKKMAEFGTKVLKKASATKITSDFSNDGTGIHYAGTTRMGSDKTNAIVDGHLKSFEHDNLYICDGGVIPHLPDKHLTLTIMALAMKLAHHVIDTQREAHV